MHRLPSSQNVLSWALFWGMAISMASAATAAPVSPEDLKRLVSEAAVHLTVVAKDGSGSQPEIGTAFLISRDGYAITANHVVNDWLRTSSAAQASSPIVARLGGLDGQTLGLVTVVASDEVSDFALVKVEDQHGARPLPVCPRISMVEGRAVYSFGFADGHALAMVQGEFGNDGHVTPAKGPDDPRRDNNPAHFWEVTSPLAHGMSGGPVFDEWGKVVAIVEGGVNRSEVTKFVVPISRMWNTLKERLQVASECGPVGAASSDDAGLLDPGTSTFITTARVSRRWPEGSYVSLQGRGFDQRTGPLTRDQLEWSGEGIPTTVGDVLRVNSLTVGKHRIYLTGHTSEGRTNLSVMTVAIVPPEIGMSELSWAEGDACTAVAVQGRRVATLVPGHVGKSGRVDLYTLSPEGKLSPATSIDDTFATPLAHSLAISGDELLIYAAGGIRKFSIVDPAHPILEGTLTLPDALPRIDALELAPGYALIARSGDTVALMPIQGGKSIVASEGPGMGGGTGSVGDVVLVPRRYRDLETFRISEPSIKATVAGTAKDQLSTNVLSLAGPGLSAVASWSGKLDVLSLHPDGTADVVGRVDDVGNAWRLALWHDVVFVAAMADGLVGLDLTKPAHPRFVSALTKTGSVGDVAVDGDRIAFCAGDGLHVMRPEGVPIH